MMSLKANYKFCFLTFLKLPKPSKSSSTPLQQLYPTSSLTFTTFSSFPLLDITHKFPPTSFSRSPSTLFLICIAPELAFQALPMCCFSRMSTCIVRLLSQFCFHSRYRITSRLSFVRAKDVGKKVNKKRNCDLESLEL
jgi:hypothetical protein